jgi:hypothetical protein
VALYQFAAEWRICTENLSQPESQLAGSRSYFPRCAGIPNGIGWDFFWQFSVSANNENIGAGWPPSKAHLNTGRVSHPPLPRNLLFLCVCVLWLVGLVKAENVRSVTPRIHWLDAPGEQETENVRSVTPRIHWSAHFTLR